jgi:hypothetical protein
LIGILVIAGLTTAAIGEVADATTIIAIVVLGASARVRERAKGWKTLNVR